MDKFPSGTVTFLFTDIEGSTKLAQAHPDKWESLQQRHHAILQSAIKSHNGYVFQIIGDAFCAAFHTASDGLHAAIDAQCKLHNEKWGDTPVKVRMGIHTGEAELQSTGDYHGYLAMSRVQRLMSVGHGGQVLISQATQELIRDDLPKDVYLRNLGEKRLKDLIRPEHIYQLDIVNLPVDFPPLKTLDKYRHNLPVQLTSFIGREKEMTEVEQALAEHRLVSLTGSGGAGKTRLSLQVAADLLDSFPNGIWFVELASVTDSDLIPQTILSAADMQTQQGRSALDSLKDFLREKTSLVVLDNCEHLIEACARLADTLLNVAPNLKILASSREALGVRGEQAWHVPSLSIPDVKNLPTIEQLSQYEAVRLFIDRALLVQPHFAVTNDNAPAVAQICSRLDGIPLAIELAAARVKVLKVEQIAERLNDRFRLLTGGSRTALPRQQTLRAMVDWSYDLLSENEKLLLRRLSVFMGGWVLEAAEQVCSDENVQGEDILDLLTHLVDKSLVVIDEEPSQLRYRMLETVRQYAREKLFESGEGEKLHTQHLDYFVKFAEEAEPRITEPKLHGANQIEWLDRIEQELDNVRAALEWALDNHVEPGVQIASALEHFWLLRGHLAEGFQYLERLIAAKPLGISLLHAKALTWTAWFALGTRQELKATTLADTSVNMSRELGYVEGLAYSLLTLAVVHYFHSDHERAFPLAEEGLALFAKANIQWGIRQALGIVGYIQQGRGNHEQARGIYHQSLALSHEIGDIEGAGWSLYLLGNLEFEQMQYEQALAYYEECLMIEREVKSPPVIAWVTRSMGDIAVVLGQYARAIVFLQDSSERNRELGDFPEVAFVLHRIGRARRMQGEYKQAAGFYKDGLQLAQQYNRRQAMARSLAGLAELAALHDQPQKAARLLGAVNAVKELHIGLWPHERLELEQMTKTIHNKLDKTTFDAVYEEGRTMTLEQAIAYALEETR